MLGAALPWILAGVLGAATDASTPRVTLAVDGCQTIAPEDLRRQLELELAGEVELELRAPATSGEPTADAHLTLRCVDDQATIEIEDHLTGDVGDVPFRFELNGHRFFS